MKYPTNYKDWVLLIFFQFKPLIDSALINFNPSSTVQIDYEIFDFLGNQRAWYIVLYYLFCCLKNFLILNVLVRKDHNFLVFTIATILIPLNYVKKWIWINETTLILNKEL